MTARRAEVVRNTKETQITAAVNLDGTGIGHLHTGMPFLDHMLDQIVRHLLPFVGVIIGCLMVVTYVPSISLTLRDLVYPQAVVAPSIGPK